MKRRTFIAAALLAMGRVSLGQSRALPTVIRGGKCFRGKRFMDGDVGIDTAGKIVIGDPGALEGQSMIDASNRIVSPGFIDILSDNTANPHRTYSIVEKYKVGDGVTTALQMHGG